MGLREALESAQALARAVERVLAEGKVVATEEGLTFATPQANAVLRQVWYAVRGDMAAGRLLGFLQRAGLATPEARATLNALKKAVDAPGDLRLLKQALSALRGIATELVTLRSARSLFPRLTLVGRQVLLEDKHIIDFELLADDGTVRRALEVKGWTADTWRRALQAWKATRGTPGPQPDPRRNQLLQQLERLAAQLRDAARQPRGQPILVCSDKLSAVTAEDLNRFLRYHELKVDVSSVKELEITATAKRLHEAFRLPRLSPMKRGRGTP